MLKIALLNSVCGSGSTGKICVGIGMLLNKYGIDHKIFYTYGKSDYPKSSCYSNNRAIRVQGLKSRILGNYGFNSQKATSVLISKLKEYQPNIVHIHNIHGHDCNLEMLFNYLRKEKIKIVWTFHDCWAFTGYCTYFTMCGCNKWKSGCGKCPQKNTYSWLFDKSASNYARKKKIFSGLDLTIVTPSKWLANLVKESFLKAYPVHVINNGIDLSVFKPTDNRFRKENKLENKTILLGVSFEWEKRKGLDVFMELAKQLSKQLQIVLVGTNEKLDKLLPANIISVHRTQSSQELADIYSSADFLINPTREENFPTVNIESIACGTPVLTFNTGGSIEMLDETCGDFVETGDRDKLFEMIKNYSNEKKFKSIDCIKKAEYYDMKKTYSRYVDLYNSILQKGEL